MLLILNIKGKIALRKVIPPSFPYFKWHYWSFYVISIAINKNKLKSFRNKLKMTINRTAILSHLRVHLAIKRYYLRKDRNLNLFSNKLKLEYFKIGTMISVFHCFMNDFLLDKIHAKYTTYSQSQSNTFSSH